MSARAVEQALATTIDVLATANHYALDAIAAPAAPAASAAGYGTAAALPALARHAHPPRRVSLPCWPAATRPSAGPHHTAGSPAPPAPEAVPAAAFPATHSRAGSSPNRTNCTRGDQPARAATAAPEGAPQPPAVMVPPSGRRAHTFTKAATGHPACLRGQTAQRAAGLAASARSPPNPGHGPRRPERHPRLRPGPFLAYPRVSRREGRRPRANEKNERKKARKQESKKEGACHGYSAHPPS